ncbi:hypothetical protein HDU99_000422 [Rhizoclosmatium hyalinum]|nr:hypothetical protein HDU99_000422 [Rhizoclosmatium hyalinum]
MNLDFLLEESEDKKTSEELYGPIEVESFIITIKALPSLKDRGAFIDSYFELAVKETRITSQKAARKLLIEFVRRGKEFIDFTSIMDRHKLMEIFSIYHERNAKHEIHFSNLCAPSEETRRQYANRPLGQLPAPVQAFRDTMKAVPSFKDHGDIIDQLEILSKSVEDRTKFWVAFEIVRHSSQSNNTLEDLIAQVENASL